MWFEKSISVLRTFFWDFRTQQSMSTTCDIIFVFVWALYSADPWKFLETSFVWCIISVKVIGRHFYSINFLVIYLRSFNSSKPFSLNWIYLSIKSLLCVSTFSWCIRQMAFLKKVVCGYEMYQSALWKRQTVDKCYPQI